MTAKLPLENMNVLVTGGGSGIGLACAASFYRDGANVTLMGRSEQRLAEPRAALEAIEVPGKVSIVSGDVANETDVEQAVDSATAQCTSFAIATFYVHVKTRVLIFMGVFGFEMGLA